MEDPALRLTSVASKRPRRPQRRPTSRSVYVRTYEGEQRDRVSLKLPESGDQLINAVVAANPQYDRCARQTQGRSLTPGPDSGRPVVDDLFRRPGNGGRSRRCAVGRRLHPSGKLTITYPTSDTAVPPGVTNPWATANDLNVSYGDGINVGYKGYDTAGITPLFPFGYGLSYTTFGYSNLQTTPAATTGDHADPRQLPAGENTGNSGSAR